MEAGGKTARFIVIPGAEGNRYRFFCERSGMAIVTTAPLFAKTPEEELALAWEKEGRQNFNFCKKCGSWVSDAMFNVEASECVVCSPWEEPPDFCPGCGARASKNDAFCRKCGAKLFYGEE